MKHFTKNGHWFLHDECDTQLVVVQNWVVDRSGYVKSTAHTGKYLHQQIMGEAPPGLSVDHINRDRLDCRRQNLRWATRTQQAINRSLLAQNEAGCKGVQRYRRTGWTAKITVFGKIIYLGFFANVEDAIKARQEAELIYHQPLLEFSNEN